MDLNQEVPKLHSGTVQLQSVVHSRRPGTQRKAVRSRVWQTKLMPLFAQKTRCMSLPRLPAVGPYPTHKSKATN
jgi:hypothetical protein